MTGPQARREPHNLALDYYSFNGVDRCVYFRTELNEENKISQEIDRRIMAGNRTYYANVNLLKS